MRWERCINITADTERLFIKTLHNWVMYSTASFIDAQNALTLSKHAYHTWSYHWAFSSSEGDGEEMEREREGEREGDRERGCELSDFYFLLNMTNVYIFFNPLQKSFKRSNVKDHH